jgi:uncharacterized membrane protein required for colicin V production
MTMLRKLWWGVYPLGTAFWGFYVCGLMLCFIAGGLISFSSRYFHAHTIGFLLGLLLTWSYGIVASVGVWQSAKPGLADPIWMHRLWPISARGVVLIVVGRILWNLMNGGAANLMAIATGPIDFDF